MATVSQLNVRLGLLTKEFDNSLRQVERSLAKSGRRLSAIGSNFTNALTLPLAAFGAASVSFAGDIEGLKLAMRSTFETAGRSIQDADNELESLRKSALAPGLDFEQAVRGSIRLQGVGFAAEDARKTLEEMANAIALTGGTAIELDSVTRQFAQMTAKGRVLQEDVTILAENMPRIADLMQKAFGTASVEAIREMGVSGKQFVEQITAAASALPRVSGGIKNAIVNAFTGLRQALADIGEEINKVFNIGDKADQFTAALRSAVQWFKNLDDSTKRTIIQFALFAAALGPAIQAIGLMQTTTAQAISLFRSSSATIGNLTNGIWAASKAFFGLSTAMKLTVVGLAAGVIVGLYTAFKVLTADTSAAADATRAFAEATKETQSESAKELAVLNRSIEVLKSATASTNDRRSAISDLMKAYPEYLRGLDLEKTNTAELEEIQKRLTKEIIKGIAERQKATALNSIYEEQARLMLRLNQLRNGAKFTTDDAAIINTVDMLRAGNVGTAVIAKLEEKIKALGNEATKTAADFDRAFGLNEQLAASAADDDYDAAAARLNGVGINAKNAGSSFGSMGDKADDAKKKVDALGQELSDIIQRLENLNEQEAKATLGELKRLTPEAQTLPALAQAPVVSQNPFTNITTGAPAAVEAVDSVSTRILAMSDAVAGAGDIFAALGQSIGDSLAQGATTFKSFARSAVSSIAEVIRGLVQAYVANMLLNNSKFFASLGPLGVGLSVGIASAAGGAASRLIKSIGKFADGGVIRQPTLGLIGEYPGASSNPEIITPERLLRTIFRQEVGGGGPQELYSVVRGDDILLVSDRAKAKRNRYG